MNKINITPFNIEQVTYYNDNPNINGFIIGCNKFGLRQVVDFDLEMIKNVRTLTTKKVYVAVNKLMHNADLGPLLTYLKELEAINVDGIIFGDMGVYRLVKTNNINLELTYNTETTITNHYFSQMAKELGINTIEIAKEITLEEIKEICEHKESNISINIQGHLYMYQSVRKLIDNYNKVQEISGDDQKDYHLFDQERGLYYPIVQNDQGTHLLSSVDVCLINHLDKLNGANIDFYRIDGFGYKAAEYQAIVDLYIAAFNDELYDANKKRYLQELKNIVLHKKMGTGFYFKKTIY